MCSSCVIIIIVFVLVFLSCDFVRGFEKGKVRIVIELGVLKSGKRKRVWGHSQHDNTDPPRYVPGLASYTRACRSPGYSHSISFSPSRQSPTKT
jgi:hypothetical protein